MPNPNRSIVLSQIIQFLRGGYVYLFAMDTTRGLNVPQSPVQPEGPEDPVTILGRMPNQDVTLWHGCNFEDRNQYNEQLAGRVERFFKKRERDGAAFELETGFSNDTHSYIKLCDEDHPLLTNPGEPMYVVTREDEFGKRVQVTNEPWPTDWLLIRQSPHGSWYDRKGGQVQ